MKYIEDRIINRSTSDHPGPWIGKQRVYQLEKYRGDNWYFVGELIYDANGKRVSNSHFAMDSCLSGTKEWLQLEDEPVLYIKNYNKFFE